MTTKTLSKATKNWASNGSTIGEALDYGGKFEGLNLSALWHREKTAGEKMALKERMIAEIQKDR